MESGTIVRWLKSEGDKVEKGEPLYELDTEKVTQEVEADAGGVLLKILAQEGQEIQVGKAIAVIGEEGEDVPEAEAEPEEPTKVAEDEPREEGEPPQAKEVVEAEQAPPAERREEKEEAPARDGGRVKASPLARRIAKERGVDLKALRGSGPEGRIVAEDVEQAGAAPSVGVAAAGPGEVEVVELTRMRQTIARRLTEAWQAPHFQIAVSADMRAAIRLREALVARTEDEGVRPTYSDILTKVCALALMRHRAINAHYADGKVHQFPTANIGIAVAVPDGLIVPVIPN